MNWVLHARDFGLDNHFLAVVEDDASFRFVEHHWPQRAVRLHVKEIEQAQGDTLAQAGMLAQGDMLAQAGLAPGSTEGRDGAASEINTVAFKLIM